MAPASPDSSSSPAPEQHTKHVDELYGDWFLDYASYVILERAVPHINDGFKPVQRRIMHSLKELEDGRYNKVANVVGNTMKYHPHGDASIGDAMTQIGQKELLIDTQGNWGNILTGDGAAAPRYIEARLSKFALDVVYSPKVTNWAQSYDGRNKEPVTLPVKFPMLLASGVEGIAVGLSCRILPHNFLELCDASIKALRNEVFVLYPDFPQGGIMDASDYNDGQRGGRIRVRAKIETVPKRNMVRIVQIPFGTTATSIQESIVAANEKGKIKVQKVEDNTAEFVEILVHLPSGTDPDQAIQALYAFTDCEVSISVNAVVIQDDKPRFISVTELLRDSAEHTRQILKQELEVELNELEEKWHFSSLEKIFIEKRIYRDIEEATSWDAVIGAIWKGLKPYLRLLKREVTEEDINRLTEIRIKRISKFNSFEADEAIVALEREIEVTQKHLKQLTRYAVAHFERLKKDYGKDRERRTQIMGFERVAASEVAIANETLYLDSKEGFAGYGLKKEGEAIGKCSALDEVLYITREGSMSVVKAAPKFHVGKNPCYVAVFKRDEQAVYSMIYRDGKAGKVYAKRFRVGGITRDKEYQLTSEEAGTRVLYFARHESEDDSNAQKLLIKLKHELRMRVDEFSYPFGELAIKGRESKGNIVTEKSVEKITHDRGEKQS
ncbi:topoisomerase-4 subunit A [Roseimicrobium gellanilyticum]|uniref:Topoisomerase-4 subunit A n=1 Tax=Roseimicrobium gellanilyticum TaxID=748857 RepID=A0A366HTG6_9BACT|nr:DNA gyrase/topoisomerase IV subunit A [Roseimicrobium gellanilyticum]RBP46539.1 topoisomerase-4 subunit A [Roseimicrobium gellanilyticum]